ncbi:MAG TPA: VOC family protein [Chitinophagaceae bacterium]|nr:VOC family protein [Chitinophagaceae bacterium]
MPIQIEGMAPLLQVFDLLKSLKFYRDVLGFTVQQSSGEDEDMHWVSLHCNGVDLMLHSLYEIGQRPAMPDPARTEAHKDTVIFFGSPDIDQAYQHLREHGVALAPPEITGYGWKAINFYDPDGYQICMHWPATDEG